MHDRPDIVLLDLNLPGHYDGFEVCRRLRMDPTTREVPIVIISALDDAESREKAASAGATAYFTKPFSPIALLKEIETLKGQIGKS
jgi:CheY-like chemotaxis protein